MVNVITDIKYCCAQNLQQTEKRLKVKPLHSQRTVFRLPVLPPTVTGRICGAAICQPCTTMHTFFNPCGDNVPRLGNRVSAFFTTKGDTMTKPGTKRLTATIFPISKRLFDFWFKLFEDTTKWSLAAAVPYFKLSSAPVQDRWLNVLSLLFIAISCYCVMWWFSDNEAWTCRKEDEPWTH